MRTMGFKHIKRPEEVPPAAPVQKAAYQGAHHDGAGIHSFIVTSEVMDFEPESSWRTTVYNVARQTGYCGTMHEFFCRDVKEMPERDHRAIRVVWHVSNKPRDCWVDESKKEDPKWAQDYFDEYRRAMREKEFHYNEEQRKAYDKETYDQILAKDYWHALTDIDKKSRF